MTELENITIESQEIELDQVFILFEQQGYNQLQLVLNSADIAIPLILHRLKIDPAQSGAVILTTVTDVVGFMSFLGLAKKFLV